MNDWKKRLGVVYSTNPDFGYETDQEHEEKNLPPSSQTLRVVLDKKGRKGKQVTLVTGFLGTEEQRVELCKTLKQRCGVGGSVKDSEILVQGDQCDKIKIYLREQGYKLK